MIYYLGNKIRLKFSGGCLKQHKLSYAHEKTVNSYIVYELGASSSFNDDPTLKRSLFGAVRITKNANIDKYQCSVYGIEFDRKSTFSLPGGRFGQNIIILGADMSFSVHVDDKKKDILIIGKGPTQVLEHTLTAEKMYSTNFTMARKKNCLNLHYNGSNSYLFVNGTEIIKFKAKDSELVTTPLCLGNIPKDWSVGKMERTGFNGYIYDFSVDYDAIAVDNILDIYKYLMKNNNMI